MPASDPRSLPGTLRLSPSPVRERPELSGSGLKENSSFAEEHMCVSVAWFSTAPSKFGEVRVIRCRHSDMTREIICTTCSFRQGQHRCVQSVNDAPQPTILTELGSGTRGSEAEVRSARHYLGGSNPPTGGSAQFFCLQHCAHVMVPDPRIWVQAFAHWLRWHRENNLRRFYLMSKSLRAYTLRSQTHFFETWSAWLRARKRRSVR
jgi:hypothetical protein